MEHDPRETEKQAYHLLNEEKYSEAFCLFKKAAEGYRVDKNHKQAALCFASAASCWAIRSGEKTFQNAAVSYEEAAREAEKAFDFEYASLLYKYAATNYERDMEFVSFSDCFYRSKECLRKFLNFSFVQPRKIHHILRHRQERGLLISMRRVFQWIALTFTFLLWGHGERPFRTLLFGIFIIIICAVLYSTGTLTQEGAVFRPSLAQSVYLSVITFSTVGYGDITPIGLTRAVAMVEALSGLFIVPIFIIGLSRKYLRM